MTTVWLSKNTRIPVTNSINRMFNIACVISDDLRGSNGEVNERRLFGVCYSRFEGISAALA